MKIRDAKKGVAKLNPNPPRHTTDTLWTLDCDCGARIGWTKISNRPGGSDLSADLQSFMAKELAVPIKFFKDLVACTKERADYLLLRGHGH